MKYIYLVIGSTGEHDDAHNWNVCAFETKANASRHAKLAQNRANIIYERFAQGKGEHGFIHNGGCGGAEREGNRYDPQMSMDYTSTDYNVQKVELR